MKLTQRRPEGWALSLLTAATVVFGLQVAPGSPCAHNCLASSSDNNWSADASNTNSSEITCSDAAYSGSKVGIKYKQCVDCLRTSSRGNWGETDAKWFVYNLRYTLDVCLYDSPQADPAVATSPCASNQGCKNLKAALTGDELAPTQNMTWNYCFRDDGAFMSSNRATCMQCLRETQDQTYMANFLTALEAGCRQTPEKGTAIGLSGTVFSSEPVNITDPDKPPAEEHDSLSTGAIIGIAIGVIVAILVAIALILVYCHKQKVDDNWEDHYYDAYATGPSPSPPQRHPQSRAGNVLRNVHYLPTQPKPMAETVRAMQVRRNSNTANYEEKPKELMSSGEYYDSMEWEMRNGNNNSYAMKEMNPVGAHSTGTLHSNSSVCDGRSVSRGRSRTTVRDVSPPSDDPSVTHGGPSPPASVHKNVRSNTPDSFAVQVYLDAAAESARMAAAAAAAPAPSSISSPGSTKRRSMLSLLSLQKRDKESQPLQPRYILQPPLTNDKAFHGDKNISRPILAREEPRFLDGHTMSSAVHVAPRMPRPPTPSEQNNRYMVYTEVPLKNCEKDLWG
ncbi:hypothetical protein BBO_05276 [Beauveria brongniartii RCEF 3172]|uniref:LPXTG-domain-containing protein n=1 Tax=Beauveria brongniartii RCEF 3172 TaxID=1081107 RepID=A0A167D3Z0_9HYPO|nr:hypothetical protein BBO_05276 [Beauveria brongniartii RCEF 3172]